MTFALRFVEALQRAGANDDMSSSECSGCRQCPACARPRRQAARRAEPRQHARARL